MNALSLYQHCPMGEMIQVLRPGQDALTGQTMDLSDTLMRIRFEEPLDPGTPVHVNLDFSKPDASTDRWKVSGEVLDHFREPESDLWQVGIRLHFDDPDQERRVLGYLSSCEGMF